MLCSDSLNISTQKINYNDKVIHHESRTIFYCVLLINKFTVIDWMESILQNICLQSDVFEDKLVSLFKL